ncbi:MAG: alpha/beta hydrolase [Microscillaceae bacterium]|nr:alpha/beta hydrolase [Microscillaceae bacterium]
MNQRNNNSEKLFLQKWGNLYIPSMHLKLTRLSNFIEYKYFKIHYKKIGSGPKAIIAFYGFGQDMSSYNCMIEQFNKYYTVYVPELFFHGHSIWKKNNLFLDKQIWKDFLRLLMEKEKIIEFSLIGFSLGAKLALVTLEAYPEKVRQLVLLAPDGIRENFWYKSAVRTLGGRLAFRFLRRYPKLLLISLKLLLRQGYLDKASHHFLSRLLQNPAQRAQLYNTWVLYRGIQVDIQKISQTIVEREIKPLIFLGKKDPWFTLHTIEPMVKRVSSVRVIFLDATHAQVIRRFADYCRIYTQVI